jgi:hypothetical protein
MKQFAENMHIPKCRNQRNNNCQKPVQDTIDSATRKLQWVADNLACPFKTKIVRDMAGLTSLPQTADKDSEELINAWAVARLD